MPHRGPVFAARFFGFDLLLYAGYLRRELREQLTRYGIPGAGVVEGDNPDVAAVGGGDCGYFEEGGRGGCGEEAEGEVVLRMEDGRAEAVRGIVAVEG